MNTSATYIMYLMKFSIFIINLLKYLKKNFYKLRNKIFFYFYYKFHFIGNFKKISDLKNSKTIYPEKLSKDIFLINKNLADRYKIVIKFIRKLNKKNLNILEIGGGANPQHIYLNKYVKNNVKSYILETKNFCQNIKEKIPKKYRRDIFYYYDIKKINLKKIDIAIFTSSIQYLKKYLKILKKISNNSIKYIIVTESIFTNFDKDLFVIQKNLDFLIPCCWISKKQFIYNLSKFGYNLLEINERKNKFYRHNTLKNTDFAIYDLVFSKK